MAFRKHIAGRRASYTDKVEKPAHSKSQTGADTQSTGVHSPSLTAVTAALSDIHQTSLAQKPLSQTAFGYESMQINQHPKYTNDLTYVSGISL